jgi:oligopeptide/dipeptide ABC transporter ATP-binding protein
VSADVPSLEAIDLLRRFRRRGAGRTDGAEPPASVDGVSVALPRGEVLGIVGESGAGKTTLARLLAGLERPDRGEVRLDGVSLADLDRSGWRRFRRRVQIVFQDPLAALNPRRTLGQAVTEPVGAFALDDGERRVREALEAVALDASILARYPHEVSGGQRQRLCIARALVVDPDWLIADEPVSALDVSVQARVLDVLRGLRRRGGLGLLLISHDLAVIQQLAERVAVMYRGQLVEVAPAKALFERPRHPYTRALIEAVPSAIPGAPRPRAPVRAPGQAPRAGCPYRDRCPQAEALCSDQAPAETRWATGDGERRVKCHFHERAS